jgi:hypothetical protein
MRCGYGAILLAAALRMKRSGQAEPHYGGKLPLIELRMRFVGRKREPFAR